MRGLFLFLTLICILSSCTKNIHKEGLLWEISGNGLKQSSYILGTGHGFTGEFLARIPRFTQAFDSVSQLIVEVDMDFQQKTIPEFEELKVNNFLPKEITYSDLLTPEDLLFLDSLTVGYLNTTIDKVTLKPDALYKELCNKIISEETPETMPKDSFPEEHPARYMAGFTKKLFMDMHLYNEAKTRGYNTIGLETLEYQIKLKFHPDISLKLEAKSLLYKLKNAEYIAEAMMNVIYSYFDQDLNRMMDNFDSITRLSGLSDSYVLSPIDEIKKRNLNWISPIKSAIENESSMIAVGAGHLPGEWGLINLLRGQGYIVEEFK